MHCRRKLNKPAEGYVYNKDENLYQESDETFKARIKNATANCRIPCRHGFQSCSEVCPVCEAEGNV